jgi:lysophospholipid acyltransferase (LPLAT)-like uncharacterized protein
MPNSTTQTKISPIKAKAGKLYVSYTNSEQKLAITLHFSKCKVVFTEPVISFRDTTILSIKLELDNSTALASYKDNFIFTEKFNCEHCFGFDFQIENENFE